MFNEFMPAGVSSIDELLAHYAGVKSRVNAEPIRRLLLTTDRVGEPPKKATDLNRLLTVSPHGVCPLSSAQIIAIVAKERELTVKHLLSRTRQGYVIRTRQDLMWLLRTIKKYSHEHIGTVLGGRNHTTVMWAVGEVAKWYELETIPNRNDQIIRVVRGDDRTRKGDGRKNAIPVLPRHWTPEMDARILEMYRAGKTCRAIADETRYVHRVAISERLKRLGITVVYPTPHWTREEMDALTQMFNEGVDNREIGARLGKTLGAVRKKLFLLKKNGQWK
jgi:hypothetical protein